MINGVPYSRLRLVVIRVTRDHSGFISVFRSSGDFSHGPQHVFWTCLDQIVKSRTCPPKTIPGFWTGLNENGRVAKNQNKIY